jgi:hypothetical protein
MSSHESLRKGVFTGLSLLLAGPLAAQSTSEDRNVTAFSELRTQQGIDVYLTQGSRESLRIEVEGAQLEDVMSTVEGNVLKLSMPNDWSWTSGRRVTAHVGFVRLTAISASGGADVHSRNALRLDDLEVAASGGSDVDLDVQARNLELTVSGGSDLDLRGSTSSLTIAASGGSDADASSMAAERVELRVSGGSDASVRASAAIEIDASGGSDIEVAGNPAERNVNNDRSSDVTWR